jgi:hypothetical protein
MDYGMFTDAGNAVIGSIVEMSRKHQLSWHTVHDMLEAISLDEVYEEARDTAVMEAVYETLFASQHSVDQ